jgi:putative MATE family efflux protein
MRHVVMMSMTSAVALTVLFMVDLVDMFFLSLLGEQELAAAVGYASTVVFLTTSVSIGLSIATTTLVSRAIGAGQWDRARQYTVSCLVYAFVACSLFAGVVLMNIPAMLSALGAEGHTHALAAAYLYILVPSLPVLGLNMSAAATLRSLADARMAMIAIMVAGLTNAVLDPILIFGLDMNIRGAAAASVVARFAMAGISLMVLHRKHRFLVALDPATFRLVLGSITAIAIPAVLTNLATPLGNAFVTRYISAFGDSAIAGFAVLGRVAPVAFAVIFALSGAIGPIVGQNLGAGRWDRVKQTLWSGLAFCFCYVFLMCLLLFLVRGSIISIFGLQGQGAALVDFFCIWLTIGFFPNGVIFCCNAAFNTLGRPLYATTINILKASLFTVPFVIVGAGLWGAKGILAGQVIGGTLCGLFAFVWTYRFIQVRARVARHRIRRQRKISVMADEAAFAVVALSPQSSGLANTGTFAVEIPGTGLTASNLPDQQQA